MEYKIISEEAGWIKAFVTQVNDAIKEGWRPLGGICVTAVPNDPLDEVRLLMGVTHNVVYYQAMVKGELTA